MATYQQITNLLKRIGDTLLLFVSCPSFGFMVLTLVRDVRGSQTCQVSQFSEQFLGTKRSLIVGYLEAAPITLQVAGGVLVNKLLAGLSQLVN